MRRRPDPRIIGEGHGGTGLNRGGDRQANHALWRIVITRLSSHPATRAYVERRTEEGLSKTEIIRCLKRYVAREVYHHLRRRRLTPQAPGAAWPANRLPPPVLACDRSAGRPGPLSRTLLDSVT